MELSAEALAGYRIDSQADREQPALAVVHMLCATDLHIPGGYYVAHAYLGELLGIVAEHEATCPGHAPTETVAP